MAETRERLSPWLTALLVVLALLRVLYHCTYLAEVPFALATFSDGRQYELAARDILASPPLGTRPFYLQGLYAYLMALPMAIRAWVSLALLFQLAIAGLTHWWFARALARWRGRTEAAWASVALLSFPMLAFYENKFLTGSLAVTVSVAVLAAAVRVREASTPARWAALGVAVGVAILARPNFALLVPVVGVAALRGAGARGRTTAAFVLGVFVAVLPMAARNAAVTGRATVFPAHGGGTSFYIGNNAHARGVWNDAGGLLSGDVSRERQELRETLGVPPGPEAEEIAAIGRALYARGLAEIADDPMRWMVLEVRKVWLMLGNDELTQDYDHFGERELLWCSPRFGLPFGVGFALAVFGIGRARNEGAVSAVLLGLALSTFAANVLYFTSAQHRLPWVLPMAVLLPDGVRALRRAAAQRRWVPLVVFAALLGASVWPRARKTDPSAVHYYNLAIAWFYVGQPDRAISTLDRALEVNPDHPVIRLQRLTALRERGHFEAAKADLDRLDAQENLPGWVRAKMEDERMRLRTWLEYTRRHGGS
ncbi:MAG: tetratricopeptide repeat protein [Nannocystaceae bacterium]|nr:tetratricopeptide repeat protein [bacterium]